MLVLNDDTFQCRDCYIEENSHLDALQINPGRVVWGEYALRTVPCATCGLSDKEIKEIENATP